MPQRRRPGPSSTQQMQFGPEQQQGAPGQMRKPGGSPGGVGGQPPLTPPPPARPFAPLPQVGPQQLTTADQGGLYGGGGGQAPDLMQLLRSLLGGGR